MTAIAVLAVAFLGFIFTGRINRSSIKYCSIVTCPNELARYGNKWMVISAMLMVVVLPGAMLLMTTTFMKWIHSMGAFNFFDLEPFTLFSCLVGQAVLVIRCWWFADQMTKRISDYNDKRKRYTFRQHMGSW